MNIHDDEDKQKKGCCGDGESRTSGPHDKIVVTGAGGFVGRKLVERLADAGYKVRVLVRNDKYEEFFRLHRAEIFTGDIRDTQVHDWLMDGACGVFHLASIVQAAGIPDSEFWDTHVTATRRLVDAAIKAKVKRFVHCSTIGVLGHISNPPADEDTPYNVEDIYQVTKAEGEKVALERHGRGGLEVVVVRPAAVYGPGDTRMRKLFNMIVTGKWVMIGDGETLIHPVYVDDLVEGMALAYEADKAAGRVYILGGEKYVSLNEWVATVAKEGGVSLPTVNVPYLPMKLAAILCENVCRPFGIEPPLFQRRVDFFVKNRAFSIDRAKRELGYAPKVDIREGARKTLEWYNNYGWE